MEPIARGFPGRPSFLPSLPHGNLIAEAPMDRPQSGATRPSVRGTRVNSTTKANLRHQPDSLYAWSRAAASLALATMGGIGLWAPVVVLKTVETEFQVGRGGASLPYTVTMIGFAVGGVTLGRVADKFGILPPLLIGAVTLGLGFITCAYTGSYWQFLLVQAVLIGMLGSSAT